MREYYADQSRRNWYRTDGCKPNIEQLQFGALQRIADATEKMARPYTALLDEVSRLRTERDNLRRWLKTEERRVAALRGHLARAKR